MAWLRASKSGGGGGSDPVLLWTNPSPTSGFPAQTISLDLSSYDYALIYCKAYHNQSIATNREGYNMLPVDGNERTIVAGFVGAGTCTRKATASANDATFTTGYTNTTASTSACIPLYIWGVKATLSMS